MEQQRGGLEPRIPLDADPRSWLEGWLLGGVASAFARPLTWVLMQARWFYPNELAPDQPMRGFRFVVLTIMSLWVWVTLSVGLVLSKVAWAVVFGEGVAGFSDLVLHTAKSAGGVIAFVWVVSLWSLRKPLVKNWGVSTPEPVAISNPIAVSRDVDLEGTADNGPT